MSLRATWRGVITFGSIHVQVKLYSAVEDTRVHFRLLHDQDEQPLEQRLVCDVCEEQVQREDAVKGIEVEEGEYVVVDPEELESLEPESSRVIEVTDFVKPGDIDIRYYERPYFLGPDGKEDPYVALRAAMKTADRAGVCRWVMRKREYLGALVLRDDCLCLVTLRRAREVRPAPEAETGGVKLSDAERKTAKYLIEELSKPFDAEEYENAYRTKLRELVEAKAKGKKPKLERPKKKKPTESEELMEALSASLEAVKKSKKSEK